MKVRVPESEEWRSYFKNQPERIKALMSPELRLLAEVVRDACMHAALSAYEDAGIQGLCAEGRWECAIGAIHGIDLEAIFSTFRSSLKSLPQPPAQE